MIEHKKFTNIEQFRSVVRNAPKEKLYFEGTVKLHGTNAAIVATSDGEFYAQSRTRIITPEDDNYGFARFAHDNYLKELTKAFTFNDYVAIYGEWCGNGIQKGVGISQLKERIFVIFAVKVDDEWLAPSRWTSLIAASRLFLQSQDWSHDLNVFSIYQFSTFRIEIDFNCPELAIAELRRITEHVEARCPVAATFGVDGIGKGVVWLNSEHDLIFKVKGEKHSVSQVKTLAAVDVEKISSINEFLDYALTENRLLQAQGEITPDLDVKKMGEFLRWVFNDIIKEESDVMMANGIDQKEIGRYISARAKDWFFKQPTRLNQA